MSNKLNAGKALRDIKDFLGNPEKLEWEVRYPNYNQRVMNNGVTPTDKMGYAKAIVHHNVTPFFTMYGNADPERFGYNLEDYESTTYKCVDDKVLIKLVHKWFDEQDVVITIKALQS